MPDVDVHTTDELDAATLAALRALLDAAFDGAFDDEDWAHACGGWHAVVRAAGGSPVAHAAVVPRSVRVGSHEVLAGYVEAVAVAPELQGRGLGRAVMEAVGDVIRTRFPIGVLSTGEWPFYERLGWSRWQGPTSVRYPDGRVERTADEDDGIMVLDRDHRFDPTLPIGCDDRPGDAW